MIGMLTNGGMSGKKYRLLDATDPRKQKDASSNV